MQLYTWAHPSHSLVAAAIHLTPLMNFGISANAVVPCWSTMIWTRFERTGAKLMLP